MAAHRPQIPPPQKKKHHHHHHHHQQQQQQQPPPKQKNKKHKNLPVTSPNSPNNPTTTMAPLNQRHAGGFATTTGTHQGQSFPRRHLKTSVPLGGYPRNPNPFVCLGLSKGNQWLYNKPWIEES